MQYKKARLSAVFVSLIEPGFSMVYYRYSFSEAIPIFFNCLKLFFFIQICQNVVLSKIDITMTTINKKTLKVRKAEF